MYITGAAMTSSGAVVTLELLA